MLVMLPLYLITSQDIPMISPSQGSAALSGPEVPTLTFFGDQFQRPCWAVSVEVFVGCQRIIDVVQNISQYVLYACVPYGFVIYDYICMHVYMICISMFTWFWKHMSILVRVCVCVCIWCSCCRCFMLCLLLCICSFPSLWLQHGTSFGFTLAESDLAMEDPPGVDHENLFNIGIFYC